jgi:hypothetical protein
VALADALAATSFDPKEPALFSIGECQGRAECVMSALSAAAAVESSLALDKQQHGSSIFVEGNTWCAVSVQPCAMQSAAAA